MRSLLIAATLSGAAWAVPVLATPQTTTVLFNQTNTVGYQITLSNSFQVNALGVADSQATAGPVATGIWNSAGTLLASVTVNSTSTLLDGFRYASVTPFIIGPGTYTLGALIPVGERVYVYGVVTTQPGVSYSDVSLRSAGNSLQLPTGPPNFPGGFFGPNLDATPIAPELDPACSLTPLFTLVLGLAASRRPVRPRLVSESLIPRQ